MNDNFITKEECETDERYGFYAYKRPIKEHIQNSIFILDKPKGPTSHQVSAWVRDILHVKKVGHAGTLDPGVTGVLVETIDNATKIMPILINSPKEYVCLMKLHKKVGVEKIQETMERLVGTITQIPPVKSAVKRVKRQRTVYYSKISEIDEQYVLFKIGTQAGTYIRKICDDLGKELCVGAHMQELRRTKSGRFEEKDVLTLYDLKDAYEMWKEDKNEEYLRSVLQPMEEGVKHMNKVIIKDSTIAAICHGAPLHVGGICKLNKIEKGEIVAIMSLKEELVALGSSKMDHEEILSKNQGIAIKINRVVMKKDTYPKMWKR